VWDEVLKTLRDDMQRAYRIDIETNSTVEPEATEDQKHIAEVMNALAQYLNGIAPLVVKGVLPFEAAQSMLLAITRRFRFGPEIEDYIKAMKQPQPEGQEQKQAEMQAMQLENQQKQMELQAKQQEAAQKAQLEERKAALEMEQMEREAAFKREEHDMKLAELRAKAQYNALMAEIKSRQLREKAAAKPKEGASAPV
jgi:hypothetical protein